MFLFREIVAAIVAGVVKEVGVTTNEENKKCGSEHLLPQTNKQTKKSMLLNAPQTGLLMKQSNPY